MKAKSLLIFIFTLVYFSCTPPVVFDKPYPEDEANLDNIPQAYKGAFMCESDSSLVIIKDKTITLRKEQYFEMGLSEVEEREECSIAGSEMYISGRHECVPLEFINDTTVRGTIIEYDTLFIMSTSGVARMYKGNVILSQELKNNEWAISLLTLESNSDISYKAITDKTKIKLVKKITPTTDITIPRDKKSRYKIRPSKEEFETLINNEKIFIECEYLTRINLEESFMYLY